MCQDFLFKAEQYPIVRMCHILFISSSVASTCWLLWLMLLFEHGCIGHWFLFWWDIRDLGVDSVRAGCVKEPLYSFESFLKFRATTSITRSNSAKCLFICPWIFFAKSKNYQATLNVEMKKAKDVQKGSVWNIIVKLWQKERDKELPSPLRVEHLLAQLTLRNRSHAGDEPRVVLTL